MSYIRSAAFADSGYVVLDTYNQAADPEEWLDLTFVDWKSSGDTRFAPIASAFGQMECNGFWNHTPPRADKDGVWVQGNVERAPILKARAEEPGANVGRCRVIELQPNDYETAVYNLHQDDNNRLNPDGTGWIVRGFFNLSDNPDSVLILREDRFDPSTEVRIPLPAGSRLIVDTQRFWHAVWHTGPEPRFSLITSWTSGPELDEYIEKYNGKPQESNPPLDQKVIDDTQTEVNRRLAERAAVLSAKGKAKAQTDDED
ncbi:hypothetical protein [Subtercola frigoramans]|uniref:Uncharacterized protein n=1 Tax=Subtercola frigoramans TaxID=120298 RepID=A0ABS2L257_9MICO|nr:hypothetical protein [Subtercola frigoramans]MBM7471164.1 hypothetical protein [Subtercola frigoramans]